MPDLQTAEERLDSRCRLSLYSKQPVANRSRSTTGRRVGRAGILRHCYRKLSICFVLSEELVYFTCQVLECNQVAQSI